MPRRMIKGKNVFDATIERYLTLYEGGHRVVVSFSGGKDSGVCLEMAIIAATMSNRLPVEVVMRDDEIMLPGTFAYCERVANRPEVDMKERGWMVAGQPCINVFNRKAPYFWCFDERLSPDEWMRKPPDYANYIDHLNIDMMVTTKTHPPKKGKNLYVIIGLRVQESVGRRMGLMSSKSWITKTVPNSGVKRARPIYDWIDQDVWLAHQKYDWDYNSAYDAMARLGYNAPAMRIAPPTQAPIAVKRDLILARKAFPRWFHRLSVRLNGVRTASKFGLRAIQPRKILGETWETCYKRECIEDAPDWIKDRAIVVMIKSMEAHKRHAQTPYPEIIRCPKCKTVASWRDMAKTMYMGDPFCFKTGMFKRAGKRAEAGEYDGYKIDKGWGYAYMEPEFFRDGTGTWGGSPGF